MWLPISSTWMFHFLNPCYPGMTSQNSETLACWWLSISFSSVWTEKQRNGPVFQVSLGRERNLLEGRSILRLNWALWVTHFLQEFSCICFSVWSFIHIITNNRIWRNKFEMMACFYSENLNTKEPMWTMRLEFKAFKSILGLQIITSMLVFSRVYFYSDK